MSGPSPMTPVAMKLKKLLQRVGALAGASDLEAGGQNQYPLGVI